MSDLMVNDENTYLPAEQLNPHDRFGNEQFQPTSIDWVECVELVTSVASTRILTFSNADFVASEVFRLGDKLRWKSILGGSYLYAYVTKVTATTITINGGSSYPVTTGSIVNLAYSRLANPLGHPVLIKINPALTALSAVYTAGAAAGINYQFMMTGPLVFISVYDLGGASVSGFTYLRFTLPVTAQKGEEGHISVLNGTRTAGLVVVADNLSIPINPELYGVIKKTVAEDPLIAGTANHTGFMFYTAQT